MFLTVMPGLATLVRHELDGMPGVAVTDSGFDGRSDVILVEVDRGSRKDILSTRTAEDVFVEVGRTLRSDGNNPRWIAGRIWRPERIQRALSIWADEVRPLSSSMTFRVIARVLEERTFLRTDLRRHLTEAIKRDKNRWRIADPAQIEVWISEYAPGRFVAGLRLSDQQMRQHGGRQEERRGALRPTVAAAMVLLAGAPEGVLLDPCCGSGTILKEAAGRGWTVEGRDIDTSAVQIAGTNVPAASVKQGDARKLDMPDSAVRACVSNLPFGQQFDVQSDMTTWLRTVLGEMARVTRSNGPVVVLAPSIPRSSVPAELDFDTKWPIRLLGTKTTLWVYNRARR